MDRNYSSGNIWLLSAIQLRKLAKSISCLYELCCGKTGAIILGNDGHRSRHKVEERL